MSADGSAEKPESRSLEFPKPQGWDKGVLHLSRAELVMDCMLVQMQGDFRIHDLITAIHVIFDLAAKHKPRVLLCDARPVSGALSMSDRYEMATALVDRMLIANKRFQIVLCANEAQLDPDRFGQLVAQNRGMSLEIALDMDEALAKARLPISAAELL